MNISPALFWWNVVSFSKAAHILTVILSRPIFTLTRKFDNLPTCYSNLLFIIYLFVSCLQILVEPLSLLNLILFKWTFDVVAFTFALLFHVLFRPFVSQSLSSLFSSFSFPLSTSSHLRPFTINHPKALSWHTAREELSLHDSKVGFHFSDPGTDH